LWPFKCHFLQRSASLQLDLSVAGALVNMKQQNAFNLLRH